MTEIPTAEEMEMSREYEAYQSMMIAFAKLHVKAALEAANKVTKQEDWIDDFVNLKDRRCEKRISEAYPLENIK